MSFLEKIFHLSKHHTTVKIEIIAGLSTFLTMAYIALVNPSILSAAHMNAGATFTATCLVTAFACFLVGVLANYPVAIAPAMALNAYFAYVVVLGMGYAWQTALGAVFISGLLFFVIAMTPLRKGLIDVIPKTMNMAISAGLGLFIAMLGLRNGGLIISDPHTLVTLGDVRAIPTLLFFTSFCIITALDYLRVQGAIVIGIVIATALGLITGYAHFQGIISAPPSVSPNFFQLHFENLLTTHQGLSVIFAFFLISIFDSTGTFVGILHQANLFRGTKEDNQKLSRGLIAASAASMMGGLLGTSSCSAYSESAAGVRAGGRTGLTSIIVSVLFLVTLFFSPLAKTIPTYATASALLFVGCLMVKSFSELNWEDMTETIPSVITAVMIPLTFSIAVGMGLGFISYALIKLLTGKIKNVHPALIIWAIIFVGYFAACAK